MQVGLHHDREQRLTRPSPALQQRREERSVAQFWICSSRSPAVLGQGAGAVPVALGGAALRALVQGGAARLGQLGLEKRSLDRLLILTDMITNIGDLSVHQELRAGQTAPRPW